MISFETSATISRAADDVWAYAVDIRRHPDWMAVADAHVLQGDGTLVGSRGRERLLVGPFKWDVEFEVIEAVPGRRVVWRSTSGGPMMLQVSLDLEPIDATSSRATYGATAELHGVWRLLTPFLAMEGKSGQARELARLKDNVEAASPAPAAVAVS